MVTWRKTKNDEWVAFGPASEVKAGNMVSVTKKNGGSSKEFVERVGKEFDVEGTPHVYGYLLKSEKPRYTKSGGGHRGGGYDWPGKECPRCESEELDSRLSCWECGYVGRGKAA